MGQYYYSEGTIPPVLDKWFIVANLQTNVPYPTGVGGDLIGNDDTITYSYNARNKLFMTQTYTTLGSTTEYTTDVTDPTWTQLPAGQVHYEPNVGLVPWCRVVLRPPIKGGETYLVRGMKYWCKDSNITSYTSWSYQSFCAISRDGKVWVSVDNDLPPLIRGGHGTNLLTYFADIYYPYRPTTSPPWIVANEGQIIWNTNGGTAGSWTYINNSNASLTTSAVNMDGQIRHSTGGLTWSTPVVRTAALSYFGADKSSMQVLGYNYNTLKHQLSTDGGLTFTALASMVPFGSGSGTAGGGPGASFGPTENHVTRFPGTNAWLFRDYMIEDITANNTGASSNGYNYYSPLSGLTFPKDIWAIRYITSTTTSFSNFGTFRALDTMNPVQGFCVDSNKVDPFLLGVLLSRDNLTVYVIKKVYNTVATIVGTLDFAPDLRGTHDDAGANPGASSGDCNVFHVDGSTWIVLAGRNRYYSTDNGVTWTKYLVPNTTRQNHYSFYTSSNPSSNHDMGRADLDLYGGFSKPIYNFSGNSSNEVNG